MADPSPTLSEKWEEKVSCPWKVIGTATIPVIHYIDLVTNDNYFQSMIWHNKEVRNLHSIKPFNCNQMFSELYISY